jgi:hypothetical protein
MMRSAVAIAALGLVVSESSCQADSASQCVAAKLDASLQIIGLMEADRLDLKKPRLVTQLFMGPERQFAVLGKRLTENGWPAAPDGPGRLLASAAVVVDRLWVRRNVELMCRIAADNGVEWDGWDVDVRADRPHSKEI